ncbi:toll/interleukin-1 receptor domain-containing protein [Marinicella sp. S1101]|uniref:toll/interleukin-1 receptor domain-containing protein n=1 Tax=Marinicella marina TaxID=2996016 RepID=UPI002260D032|nr:toll/interleukin-1 receptor domain-containing protein [Marinicella marina]MCX7553719.1 toll/interleukin-1 receptor domain-containing protein [Marinicella marina]
MPIFISHTTKDDLLARKVYSRLKIVHSIDCYIDDMDKELENNRGKSSLTPILVDRLRKCDTLLVVVTENTKESWWVPFEIGTAREMPRVISSFTPLLDHSSYSWEKKIPEYLLEWPRLRSDSDIDTFAYEYKQKQILLEYGAMKMDGIRANASDVRQFESSLMKTLNQRNF